MSAGESPQEEWNNLVNGELADTFYEYNLWEGMTQDTIGDVFDDYSNLEDASPDLFLLEIERHDLIKIEEALADIAFATEQQEFNLAFGETTSVNEPTPHIPVEAGVVLTIEETTQFAEITNNFNAYYLKRGIFPKREMSITGGGIVDVGGILTEMRKMDAE